MSNTVSFLDFLNINTIGLLLTVSGLALTAWQTKQNSEATTKLNTMTGKLEAMTGTMEGIKDSLSTEYLSEFPHYMPRVDSLLLRAKRNILISYIIPTTCIFTEPEAWRTYKGAIEQVLSPKRKIDVRIVFPNEKDSKSFH